MGWFLVIAVIIAVGMIAYQSPKPGSRRNPRGPMPATERLSIEDRERAYYGFTGDFWHVSETLARCMPFIHGRVLIMVRQIAGERCKVSYSFESDCAVPSNISFGGGLAVSDDRERVTFESQSAREFSMPNLVRDMIIKDMSSYPGSPMRSELTEVTIMDKGDFAGKALIMCRFEVVWEER